METITLPLKPPERCLIFTLPDEILHEILSYLAPSCGIRRRSELFHPVTLVCRRWRDVYDPILFHTVNLTRRVLVPFSSVPGFCLTELDFLRILETRPHLQRYPRSIHIAMRRPTAGKHESVTKILEYCKFLRKVELHRGLLPEEWPVLVAIKSLQFLEDLSLSGAATMPLIALTFRHFDLPSLKHLSLKHYGPAKLYGNPGSLSLRRAPIINEDELEMIFPPDRYHTGRITSLELVDPRAEALMFYHILRWPVSLEALSLIFVQNDFPCPYVAEYPSEVVSELLNTHRQSLKVIKLCMIPEQGSMPSLSDFMSLQELTICATTLEFEAPESALRKLAAPSLHRLVIDFDPEHANLFSSFSGRKISWLIDFSHLKKKLYPASRLDTIFLKLHPHCADSELEACEKNVVKLRQAVSLDGLTIEYGTSAT